MSDNESDDLMDLSSFPKQYSSISQLTCHPTDAHVESPAKPPSQVPPSSSHLYADAHAESPAKLPPQCPQHNLKLL